jgi:hypothetical protein
MRHGSTGTPSWLNRSCNWRLTSRRRPFRGLRCKIYGRWGPGLLRVARSTRDLNVLTRVADKRAGFKSLRDSWADTTTPHGRLMLTALGGLAEFERELIRSRTSEGRARAKARGVVLGRKPKLTHHQRQAGIGRSFSRHCAIVQRLPQHHKSALEKWKRAIIGLAKAPKHKGSPVCQARRHRPDVVRLDQSTRQYICETRDTIQPRVGSVGRKKLLPQCFGSAVLARAS